METSVILPRYISICHHIWKKEFRPISLFAALKLIKDEKYINEIDKIRTYYSQGIFTSVRSLKRRLPALCFSGIMYDSLLKTDVNAYTSLMMVDIDKLGERLNEVKNSLRVDPNVISVWKSPSGNGLKALLYTGYVTPFPEHDTWILHQYCAFPQIADYFMNEHQVQIDKTGAEITRLCFMSADSEIHLKKEFQPFSINITLSPKEINKIREEYYRRKTVKKARKQQRKLQKSISSHSKD